MRQYSPPIGSLTHATIEAIASKGLIFVLKFHPFGSWQPWCPNDEGPNGRNSDGFFEKG